MERPDHPSPSVNGETGGSGLAMGCATTARGAHFHDTTEEPKVVLIVTSRMKVASHQVIAVRGSASHNRRAFWLPDGFRATRR